MTPNEPDSNHRRSSRGLFTGISLLVLVLAGTGVAAFLLRDPGASPTPSPASESRSRSGQKDDASPKTRSEDPFTDIAARVGIHRPNVCGTRGLLFIFENIGSGAALLDYDGDGRLDVFVNNAGTTKIEKGPPKRVRIIDGPGTTLYRQLPDGRFQDVTESAGVRFDGWGTGVAVGDIENDGDLDMFVGAYGTNRLYVNNGDGAFSEESKPAGLGRPGYAASAAFVDYDKDGFLDLYVANYVVFDLDNPPNGGEPCYHDGVIISCGPTMHPPMPDVLYHNRGNGTFEDVTEKAGLGYQPGAFGLGVGVGDLDRDGFPDIYTANDTQANFLWHNLGNGTFENVALINGVALSENAQGQAGMGVDIGDVDGDGWLDIHVSNYAEEPNAYYRNLGDGTFADETARSGIGMTTFTHLLWGTKLFDFDHDGDLDVAMVGGHVHPRAAQLGPGLSFEQRILVFRGDGRGRFAEVASELGEVFMKKRNHRGLAAGDIDRDGDLDMLITLLDGPPLLVQNDCEKLGNSVMFRLRGSRSNREGIGARIEITAGGKSQVREVTRGCSYLSANDVAVHFGVGPAKRIDKVKILWPSGGVTELGSLEVNRLYLVHEADGSIDQVLIFGDAG